MDDLEVLRQQRDKVNNWLRNNDADFILSRRGSRNLQKAPYDPIPRLLRSDEFSMLERGLVQRAHALNLFLNDIYSQRMIVKDGVIPEHFVFSSPNFNHSCMEHVPVKGIYNHISAVDLIQTASGKWYVMEDNLSLPSGATYPLVARKLNPPDGPAPGPAPAPPEGKDSKLCDSGGYHILINHLFHDMENGLDKQGGLSVVLSQSEGYNSDFELRYISEITGAILAKPEELSVMGDSVYYRSSQGGGFQKVSNILRHTPDKFIDPLVFDSQSRLGVPHLLEAWRKGTVTVINAPGTAIADDRGLYYFVPKMIRYYLDEEPIIPNIPTYLPTEPKDLKYIKSNTDKLVIKNVTVNRARGTFFAHFANKEEIEAVMQRIAADPRRYIAQDFMELAKLDTLSEDGLSITQCRADYRAYIIHSDSIRVWMGGMTRYTRDEYHTNAPAKGGFKDTWVYSD